MFFVTCDSKNALECLSSGVKYLCSDTLYFVFDRRRGSRLPAILTVYRYTEKYIYIYISELRGYTVIITERQ